MAGVAPFSMAGFRRGALGGQPLAISIVIYGVAFGLLAREVNLSLLESLLMSTFIYSGSAQLAAVSAMEGGRLPVGPALLAITATVLLLNARYVLYSAALRPWLNGLPPQKVYPTLAFLGDGSWILSMRAHAAGEVDAGYLLGSSVILFIPWAGGTAIGYLSGSLIPNPKLLAVDFLLVSFCAAMAITMVKGRGDWVIVAVAAVVAVGVDRFLDGGWALVAAGLAGGMIAYLRTPQATT